MPQSPTVELDGALFRQIAGYWLTGVAIVTSRDRTGRPVGLTMNAVTPLSLAPPMFLICLDHGSDTLASIETSKSFAINFLGKDDAATCVAFSKKGGDKFADVETQEAALGSPILKGAIAHVECILDSVFVAGDHKIVVGLAASGESGGGEPLAYFKGGFHRLCQ